MCGCAGGWWDHAGIRDLLLGGWSCMLHLDATPLVVMFHRAQLAGLVLQLRMDLGAAPAGSRSALFGEAGWATALYCTRL